MTTALTSPSTSRSSTRAPRSSSPSPITAGAATPAARPRGGARRAGVGRGGGRRGDPRSRPQAQRRPGAGGLGTVPHPPHGRRHGSDSRGGAPHGPADHANPGAAESGRRVTTNRGEGQMDKSMTSTGVRMANEATSVIDIKGEVTAASETALMSAYEEAVRQRARRLVLNFTGLKYMNSGGIGMLVTLLVRANRQ